MNSPNKGNWWQWCPSEVVGQSKQIWLTIGNLGYSGSRKQDRRALLTELFGLGGWRISHIVRGRVVSFNEAIWEYEQSYRIYLHNHPAIVNFLVSHCGNVYDFDPNNVYDDDYQQPEGERNHYQDISIRRVIAELVDDERWQNVSETDTQETTLINLSNGQSLSVPRARGFQGEFLLEVRGPESPGFFLNPAVIPVYDPALITVNPLNQDWFLKEGCGHLSVESFWQNNKVVEVRYDRFQQLGSRRSNPLEMVNSMLETE